MPKNKPQANPITAGRTKAIKLRKRGTAERSKEKRGTAERSKKRLENLKEGFPLRDDAAFKDLPQSVREGAADEFPRIVPADKKGRPKGLTKGKLRLPGQRAIDDKKKKKKE